MSETCGNCKFFKRLGDLTQPPEKGKCRFFPAGYIVIVADSEWCGQWKECDAVVGESVNEALAKQGTPIRECEEEGCPHYGTPHGHDPQDLLSTVPLQSVVQAADLTSKRMGELYPNLRKLEEKTTGPLPPKVKIEAKTLVPGPGALRNKFLAQAEETYGQGWENLTYRDKCAHALTKAENEVLYLRDRFPALLYIIQTWPRPPTVAYQDWDVMRKALDRQLRNIIGLKDNAL